MWELSWPERMLPLVKQRRLDAGLDEDPAAAWARQAGAERGILSPEQVPQRAVPRSVRVVEVVGRFGVKPGALLLCPSPTPPFFCEAIRGIIPFLFATSVVLVFPAVFVL